VIYRIQTTSGSRFAEANSFEITYDGLLVLRDAAGKKVAAVNSEAWSDIRPAEPREIIQ
jgi:hypothetical protein